MFKLTQLLEMSEVEELRRIAKVSQFVDGKISNPHSKVKNNLQLNDMQGYQKSAEIILSAMSQSEEFMNFAFPLKIAPPMMTRYEPGMNYGLHPDNALINLPDGPLRSDISATVFLNDPDTYEGGSLRVTMGDADYRFKGKAGEIIIYPSSTLHEVEKVTSGERLVAITFIQSRIPDVAKRNLLYELNEVAALEGLNMSDENYTRLQAVQYNLMRHWVNV